MVEWNLQVLVAVQQGEFPSLVAAVAQQVLMAHHKEFHQGAVARHKHQVRKVVGKGPADHKESHQEVVAHHKSQDQRQDDDQCLPSAREVKDSF